MRRQLFRGKAKTTQSMQKKKCRERDAVVCPLGRGARRTRKKKNTKKGKRASARGGHSYVRTRKAEGGDPLPSDLGERARCVKKKETGAMKRN